MENQNREHDGSSRSEQKVYEPPRILWEEDFEPTSYAKCGRLPGGGGGGCMTMPGS